MALLPRATLVAALVVQTFFASAQLKPHLASQCPCHPGRAKCFDPKPPPSDDAKAATVGSAALVIGGMGLAARVRRR